MHPPEPFVLLDHSTSSESSADPDPSITDNYCSSCYCGQSDSIWIFNFDATPDIPTFFVDSALAPDAPAPTTNTQPTSHISYIKFPTYQFLDELPFVNVTLELGASQYIFLSSSYTLTFRSS